MSHLRIVGLLGMLFFWPLAHLNASAQNNEVSAVQPDDQGGLLSSVGKINLSLPSEDLVAEWLNYPRPVRLQKLEFNGALGRGDIYKWGTLIQAGSYQAPQDSLTSYMILFYESGTFLKESREEMIKNLEEQLANNQLTAEMKEYLRIEERADQRKVYCSPLGFGPGGGMVGCFTFMPNYDLFVMKASSFEDNIPLEEKMVNPIEARTNLSEFMFKLEEYLHDTKS